MTMMISTTFANGGAQGPSTTGIYTLEGRETSSYICHLGDRGGNAGENRIKCKNKVQAREKKATCSVFL